MIVLWAILIVAVVILDMITSNILYSWMTTATINIAQSTII